MLKGRAGTLHWTANVAESADKSWHKPSFWASTSEGFFNEEIRLRREGTLRGLGQALLHAQADCLFIPVLQLCSAVGLHWGQRKSDCDQHRGRSNRTGRPFHAPFWGWWGFCYFSIKRTKGAALSGERDDDLATLLLSAAQSEWMCPVVYLCSPGKVFR